LRRKNPPQSNGVVTMQISLAQVNKLLNQKGLRVATNKWRAGYVSQILRVDTLIDIGVAEGTPELYDPRIAQRFLLVDPQPISQDVINDIQSKGCQVHCFECALGDSEGHVTLQVHAQCGHSGLLPRTEAFAKINSPVTTHREVSVRTLDSIVETLPMSLGRIGLKIDTEGYEMNILEGARKTLTQADFVIIETSVKRRFTEGYKSSDIISFMSGQGFEIFDILNTENAPPRFLDLVFIPWRSPMFDSPTSNPE